MYVFPKISLRPEVENYLKESFLNEEVGHRCLQNSDTTFGEAERKLKSNLFLVLATRLLESLKTIFFLVTTDAY